MSSSEMRPFFFNINFDVNGFYVIPGRENPIHKNNTKLPEKKRIIPPCFIPKSERRVVCDLAMADASPDVIRNDVHQ